MQLTCDIGTGYWETIAFLEDIKEHSPEVERLAVDFNGKCRRLQDLADKLVA